MNNENPPASASKKQIGFDTDIQLAALAVYADDEHHYLLPYSQFLYAERAGNPAIEKDAGAPPERLLIRFAMADVVILGSGLKGLESRLQKFELKQIEAADRRLADQFKTHMAVVSVNFNKERYE